MNKEREISWMTNVLFGPLLMGLALWGPGMPPALAAQVNVDWGKVEQAVEQLKVENPALGEMAAKEMDSVRDAIESKDLVEKDSAVEALNKEGEVALKESETPSLGESVHAEAEATVTEAPAAAEAPTAAGTPAAAEEAVIEVKEAMSSEQAQTYADGHHICPDGTIHQEGVEPDPDNPDGAPHCLPNS